MQNLIKHLLTSSALVLGALICYQGIIFLWPFLAHREFYVFLLFFGVLEFSSGAAGRYFAKDQDQQKATLIFFSLTALRLILAMFMVLLLVIRFPEQKKLLSLSFCCLYFYFLIAETILIVRYLGNREVIKLNN